MFLVSCWACAFVFCNVAYTLAVSFGGMGKALCVILLVMQVVGLGGEYPAQMLGGLFQVINPLLPFAHGVGAMQECIAVLYANTYIVDIQRLLLFLVPSLILGLALRTPLAHAANYVQSQLDRTGVM
jgi:putative membrane protein